MGLPFGRPKGAGGPTLLGLPIKQASLLTLTFQNTALILVMHYSRIMTPPGDHRYFASTAVLLGEVIKLAISLTFAIHEASRSLAPQTPVPVLLEQIYNGVFSGDGWKLAIPALLYTLENTLQYVALGNLDPGHFQVLYQLKIMTTAFFSVAILGRSLGLQRWAALVLLTIGVAVVSLPSSSSADLMALDIHDFSDHFFPRSAHELGQAVEGAADAALHLAKRGVEGLMTKRSASYEGIKEDQNPDGAAAMVYSVGVTAVVVSALVSGLTGVYFEKVLKDPGSGSGGTVSVWTRNVQLSFYSLFPALLVGVVFNDGAEIARHGFFDGYNWVVWTAIVLHAVGGVLASICLVHADNIAKNFATSVSIVISVLASLVFFGARVTLPFVVGTGMVLVSIYLYTLPERGHMRPPPIRIASYEKTTTIPGTPRLEVDQSKLLNPLDSVNAVGLSTSRPSSPMLFGARTPSARSKKFGE